MECSHGTCRPQRIWRDERCHQGTRILPAMVGLADIPAAAGAGLSKSCRTRACSSTPTRPAPDQWAAQRIISANPITSHPKRCIGPNFWRMSVGSTRVALLTIALARKDARVLPASLFINLVAQMAQCPDPQAAWWAPWGCSGGCPARNMLPHELGTDPEDNWGFKQTHRLLWKPTGPSSRTSSA